MSTAGLVRGLFTKFPLVRSGGGGVYTAAPSSTVTLDRLDHSHVVLLTPTASITLKIPVASESYIGEEYLLWNLASSYTVTVTDTDGTAICTLRGGERVELRSNSTPEWKVAGRGGGLTTLSMHLGGSLLVDGDGASTNGGGLHGDITLTNAAVGYAKCSDASNQVTTPANLATIGAVAGYGANWQLFPDTSAAGDYCAFGNDVPFCEIAFDVGTAADYTIAGEVGWEYWDGAAWTALTIAQDNTHASTKDGTKSLTRDGAIHFVPPTDWATTTIGSTTAYWVRCVVVTDMDTKPRLNSKEHNIVTPQDGFTSPVTGTVTQARITDGTTGTLHTAADVKFIVMNFTTGAHSGELTFAQDKRQDRWTGLTLAVTRGDVLGVLCTQEDGTNEVINAVVQLTIMLE